MRDRVMTALKVRENRARRVLVRMGRRLEKSPRRDERALDFCLYRIVAAAGPPASASYTMTLPEVEAWIAGPAAQARLAAKPQPQKIKDGGRVNLRVGDCRDVLRRLPTGRYHAVVTSPPYYFVRDYNHPSQIGLEESPEAYVDAVVAVFKQVRRVLHPEGTVWLNIDDTYCTRRAIRADGKRTVAKDMALGQNTLGRWSEAAANGRTLSSSGMRKLGLKDKDLMLIPARLTLALQADGWWVRSDIVWVKPNVAPGPVEDRPVHGYERVLLLTKSRRYYFNPSALRERAVDAGARSGRDIWTIRPSSKKGDHSATFPEELAARCILAGSPPGSWILDPFAGTGVTGMAAAQHGRSAMLIELSEEYAKVIRRNFGDRLTEYLASDKG